MRATAGELRAWHGSWRATYLADVARVATSGAAIRCALASDVLYQPVLAAGFDPAAFFASSRNAGHSSMRRLDARTIASSADLPREPVVLTNAIDDWPALQHWRSIDTLGARLADAGAPFRAEAATTMLATYAAYMSACAQEDQPLYLFHAAPMPTPLDTDWRTPSLFDEDLFSVLDPRPDHKWLIVGPPRSGSTMHKDPNATSAWNAVVVGSKAWVCLDPSIVPPGVRVSADEADVETPLTIAEWLVGYLAEARALYGPTARDPAHRGKLVEGVCAAGETVFVPAGWWHLVVNLEPTIAVTQNFVGANELPGVLRFLRDRPAQVSGLADADAAGLYDRFVGALDEAMRARGLAGLAELDRAGGVGMRRKEVAATEADGCGGGGFAFDFGDLE